MSIILLLLIYTGLSAGQIYYEQSSQRFGGMMEGEPGMFIFEKIFKNMNTKFGDTEFIVNGDLSGCRIIFSNFTLKSIFLDPKYSKIEGSDGSLEFRYKTMKRENSSVEFLTNISYKCMYHLHPITHLLPFQAQINNLDLTIKLELTPTGVTWKSSNSNFKSTFFTPNEFTYNITKYREYFTGYANNIIRVGFQELGNITNKHKFMKYIGESVNIEFVEEVDRTWRQHFIGWNVSVIEVNGTLEEIPNLGDGGSILWYYDTKVGYTDNIYIPNIYTGNIPNILHTPSTYTECVGVSKLIIKDILSRQINSHLSHIYFTSDTVLSNSHLKSTFPLQLFKAIELQFIIPNLFNHHKYKNNLSPTDQLQFSCKYTGGNLPNIYEKNALNYHLDSEILCQIFAIKGNGAKYNIFDIYIIFHLQIMLTLDPGLGCAQPYILIGKLNLQNILFSGSLVQEGLLNQLAFRKWVDLVLEFYPIADIQLLGMKLIPMAEPQYSFGTEYLKICGRAIPYQSECPIFLPLK